MIHYHGLPITPDAAAAPALAGAHCFVSYEHPGQLGLAVECCQTFAVDNGAFSAWKRGEAVTDWAGYYEWCANLLRVPSFDFAIIPDVIDGGEEDNDALIREWPHGKFWGVPVWHMHESLERLERLAADWHRVAIGSSGQFAQIGTPIWWDRMSAVMRCVCDDQGRPMVKLHGLRMLDPAVFTRLPFASTDSTNIGRNVGMDTRWVGPYAPPTKAARAILMRQRIEAHNAPDRWDFMPVQEGLFSVAVA